MIDKKGGEEKARERIIEEFDESQSESRKRG